MVEKLQVLWKYKVREHNLIKSSGEVPTMAKKTAFILRELANTTIVT